MLSLLRNNSKHWLVLGLVAMAVIGMSFFFGDSFKDDKGSSYAVKVDGDPILMHHFLDRYRNVLEYYKRQMGANFDEKMMAQFNVKQSLISGMVQEKILAKTALSNKLNVSSDELRDSISSIPIFQDNGNFSMDRYKGYLAYTKYSPQQFEDQRREELLGSKLESMISNASKVNDSEVEDAYIIENQKIELNFIKADTSKINSKISAEEVTAFLSTDTGKEQSLKYYTDNNEDYKKEEQVKAKHILVKIEPDDTKEIKDQKRKKAEGLLVQLTPENFSEIAKKNSDDKGSAINGGELGYFGRGRMVKPFEEKAFSMKKNSLSDIVETQFGYHILFVEDKIPASVISYDEVKNKIAEKILSERKKVEQVDAIIIEALSKKDINVAAKFLASKVEETGKITRKQQTLSKIMNSSINDVLWVFTLENKKMYKRNIGNETYIFQVKSKEKVNINKEKIAEFKKTYIADRGNLEFQNYTKKLKKEWANKIEYSNALQLFVQKEQ